MKKNIQTTEAVFPMPVLMIATYNEDDTVNIMNAAWGTMLERDLILLNLSPNHKTVENIKNKKAFTVSLADALHVKEADYCGMTSGHQVKNKMEECNLTASKSSNVNAPIINEFPLCMECEFLKFQDDEYSYGVMGKIKNVCCDEEVMTDGNVDINKLNALAFDSFTHGYYKVTERVGNAFKDGLTLKNKEN